MEDHEIHKWLKKFKTSNSYRNVCSCGFILKHWKVQDMCGQKMEKLLNSCCKVYGKSWSYLRKKRVRTLRWTGMRVVKIMPVSCLCLNSMYSSCKHLSVEHTLDVNNLSCLLFFEYYQNCWNKFIACDQYWMDFA